MLADDTITEAQAQPHPVPHFLGGKELIEDLREIRLWNAAAVIPDNDADFIPTGNGSNPDRSGLGNRLSGIEQQIHEDLVDLAGLAFHLRQISIPSMDGDPI